MCFLVTFTNLKIVVLFLCLRLQQQSTERASDVTDSKSDQNMLLINNMWQNILLYMWICAFYYRSLNIPLTHGYVMYGVWEF
jgi:small-conductance mechanosensitive channel